MTAAAKTGPVIINQINPAFGAALAAHPSAPRVIDHLDSARPWDLPEGAEILITRALPAWRGAAPTAADLGSLKWEQTYSAGVEIYPAWLTEGRLLTCGRGLNSDQIGEYALAAMLRIEKDLSALRVTARAAWKDAPVGSLRGKVLGLIGFGAIGRETATRARAFGMQVLVSRRGPWVSDEPGITACASPAEVIAAADHLVIAAPLTPQTQGLVDAALLARAKPGLHLVNVSRGGLVDQEALIDALDSGRLAAATLDVTTPEPLPEGHPLWTHPKVLLTPHISYKGGDDETRFRAKVLANLDAYLGGREMIDLVDSGRGY
ncbi:NAD(P)-dependent oxidoreductase [Frigidibacter sp. MR17.24]|uniref:NAD(P)-dependent oxidoreductase n=1 Tax=Frigidibacter sp. MR17.24 TaxID=3127345 RepID=UPI003012BC12